MDAPTLVPQATCDVAKEHVGRLVLSPERMFEICQELWASIDIKDLRPYFTKASETWKEIEKQEGAWVGWGKKAKAAHGVSI